VVENAQHVQEGREDHEMRGPAMKIAQEHAVFDDELELLHVAVCLRHGRVVIKHQ
jgi:hypothetical protein